MNRLNVTLALTPVDCFRPPEVLERIRERIRDGGCVLVSGRDHPATFPDGVDHAGDIWRSFSCVRGELFPDLVVIDNLRFDDVAGREFLCWDADAESYRKEPRTALEKTLDTLAENASATGMEVILVSEGSAVGEGWRAWFERSAIPEILPEPDIKPVLCRRWSLAAGEQIPAPAGPVSRYERYRYGEGRLLRPVDPLREPSRLRRFEARVATPRAEALLAVVGEFVAIRHEYANPDDPCWKNVRQDHLDAIVRDFGDARGLLSDIEDLYDVISEHADFSAAPPEHERTVAGLLSAEAAESLAGDELDRLRGKIAELEKRAAAAERRIDGEMKRRQNAIQRSNRLASKIRRLEAEIRENRVARPQPAGGDGEAAEVPG